MSNFFIDMLIVVILSTIKGSTWVGYVLTELTKLALKSSPRKKDLAYFVAASETKKVFNCIEPDRSLGVEVTAVWLFGVVMHQTGR